MDWAAASLLSMEAMGTARLPRVGQARDEQGSCMEHSEIGPRAMASKPKPGTGIRIAGQIFYKTGIATTVCENVLINRTAVVRDPCARWCGRGEVVRPPPYPDWLHKKEGTILIMISKLGY